MEYGLWNIHGGFWANNPCPSGDRSLYNSVNSSGGGNPNTETVPFPNVSSSPACRTNYRGQPEYVAMKPAVNSVLPSRHSDEIVTVLSNRTSTASVEMPALQNEILTEPTSQDSGNSNTLTMNMNAPPNNIVTAPDVSSNHIKKVKMSKGSRKRSSNAKPTEPPLPVQYFNQQYSPMYSMMFGRTATSKRPETSSDESDDDEDDDNANDNDNYSNESSATGNLSPQRSGLSRSGYECGQCDLVADTRPALKKHISLCHPGPLSDTHIQHAIHKLPGSCPMPTCGYRSLSREDLESHVARHMSDGFQRHVSSKKQRNNSAAISLQRVRYEREEYRCQVCSYTCTIEKAFYKHLKSHSLGHQQPAIKISCVICGKDRPSEVEMNKHMRKHRDSRFFCCDVCIFRTVQLKKLIQHRRMHTGEKPHLCPHCAYRSARRDNLRSHVRRVHKKDNLFCDTFSPRGLLLTPPSPTHGLP